MCMNSCRTLKILDLISYSFSMEQFIVDDDDDFEDDVFMDLGFTPEEYCSDKENDDCIEIATPGTCTVTRMEFLWKF